jgi:hypothetical protein
MTVCPGVTASAMILDTVGWSSATFFVATKTKLKGLSVSFVMSGLELCTEKVIMADGKVGEARHVLRASSL